MWGDVFCKLLMDLLNILCQLHCLAQCSYFIVHLLTFFLRIGVRHDARARLVMQYTLAAQKGPYHDRVIKIAIESHISDGTAVKTPLLVLISVDQLHGHVFRRSAERPGGKSVSYHIK